MVVTEQVNEDTIITLSPNRSASWQQTKWVIWCMVAVVMIIAVAWTFVGAWVVLPFAGFEVGLFALLMYKVSRFTYTKQIITIQKHQIKIEYGVLKRQSSTIFNRQSLDVYYSETDNDWQLPKISLVSNNNTLLLGEFLNLDDRKILKESLQNAGLIICRNRWWQN